MSVISTAFYAKNVPPWERPLPWLTSSTHHTTGYFTGHPVYDTHLGYLLFQGFGGRGLAGASTTSSPPLGSLGLALAQRFPSCSNRASRGLIKVTSARVRWSSTLKN